MVLNTHRITRIANITALVFVLLSSAGNSFAEQKSYKLVPKSAPEIQNGKIMLLQGNANTEGDRFFLENLSILQPVSVSVMSQDPAHDVRLLLSKYQYDEPEKQASTLNKKNATLTTRTQGELKIQVKSAKSPAPYQLLVWVGDEVNPDIPSVVVPMDTVTQESKSDSKNEVPAPGVSDNTVLWIIAAFLGVIVILLGILVFRRKAS